MTKTIILALLIAGVFAVGSFAFNDAFAAQVDYFLKIDGVDGESTEDGHVGEIEILSWSWGETNDSARATGGGGGAGKVSLQDFHFSMEYEKASPKLMEALADGKHFPGAVLTLRSTPDHPPAPGSDEVPPSIKPVEYLKIKMTDILISSYQTGGSSGSDVVPVDQISLNFAKITFEYQPQNRDGTLGDPVSGSASKHGRK